MPERLHARDQLKFAHPHQIFRLNQLQMSQCISAPERIRIRFLCGGQSIQNLARSRVARRMHMNLQSPFVGQPESLRQAVRIPEQPPGVGGPLFDGVESKLSPVLLAIPGVKGLEFGAGFLAATLRGSENNDPFVFTEGRLRTRTNHHGGILGGMTSGMPLVLRLAFKPTPSIAKPQESVNLKTGEAATLVIQGRHDPCIVPRAVPVVEAALAIGLLDLLLTDEAEGGAGR